jgi:hypothetical protein
VCSGLFGQVPDSHTTQHCLPRRIYVSEQCAGTKRSTSNATPTTALSALLDSSVWNLSSMRLAEFMQYITSRKTARSAIKPSTYPPWHVTHVTISKNTMTLRQPRNNLLSVQ